MSASCNHHVYKIGSWPAGAREGDIPYAAEWEDGSRYKVEWIDDEWAVRHYSGAVFGLAPGMAQTVKFNAFHCERGNEAL